MPKRPMFYIIDGHSLAYRQYFGMPLNSFTTKSGEFTNAVFGFTRTMLDIIQKDQPEYFAISFDAGLSGRDTWYSEYKGTRDKMPSDLASQIERIMQVVEAFNTPMLISEGNEADDVIGTIAMKAVEEGVDVRIVTGDRDLLQLLGEHVTVQLPGKGKGPDAFLSVLWDVAKFREEYELEPEQLVDYKGLVGDTSDNIPGVKGIGDKGATTLLKQYGTLEGIYDHIDEIKGSLQSKLIEGRDSAFLSRKLATIICDLPLTIELSACVSHDFDAVRVLALFDELEFRSLGQRLKIPQDEQLPLFAAAGAIVEATPAEAVVPTVIVNDATSLAALIETLNAAQGIAFDTESTGTDQMSAALVGISLATDGETGYYIPVAHDEGQQLPMQTVLDALRGPLTNPNIPKYAHNANYDLVMLQRYGIDVAPITVDTMLAAWLVDPVGQIGLKAVVFDRLKIRMTEIKELIGSGKKQLTMNQVSIERAAPYAAADAAMTYRLLEVLQPALEQDGLTDLLNTLEMPLVPVIASMERTGVVVDVAFLRELSGRLEEQLRGLQEEINNHSAGYGAVNMNSPKQLSDLLFGKLGLPTQGIERTTHGYSTAAHVLENLKGEHLIIDYILQYREVSKLKSTYVDALPQLVNAETGRVHTSFNQAGAATGRMSSSNPNLQNIPIRTEARREVRQAFVAPAGKLLLSADYSQVELRIMAHISQDPTMLDAFRQGQDIHATTASIVYGVPMDEVTKDQRIFAKRVNFGVLYGMGAYRLARDSNLTFAEAEDFIRKYFERFPRVREYLDGTIQKAEELGYVETLFGRRRNFAILKGGKNKGRQEVRTAEREAINMPIQGTAADIMKRAMIDLHSALLERNLDSRMILQVHDELVLEVPEKEVTEVRDLILGVMEGVMQLDAPLQANAYVGSNWRDMEAI
ncbi:MAG: DNA polymerase I [Burkholderiales bacterium]|nr:DNA polymerase I [Anaerolineae bacterium]